MKNRIMYNDGIEITSWPEFSKIIRKKRKRLLTNIEKFRNPILISGCQRSGTTMLSRIITKSEGITNFWFSKYDELDAALILAGHVNYNRSGRHCFQTTYLNSSYYEYFEIKNDFRMIWVIRNPYSTIYSMIFNWDKFALNELYRDCGIKFADKGELNLIEKLSPFFVKKLKKACFSYNAKTYQLSEIYEKYGSEKIFVVDYDQLVVKKNKILPEIYRFLSLEYKEEYALHIKNNSMKKADYLAQKTQVYINNISMPYYKNAKKYIFE